MYTQVGSENRKHLRGSIQTTIHPLSIILTAALCMGIGQYDSLEEYCGLNTAFSVFLILISHIRKVNVT